MNCVTFEAPCMNSHGDKYCTAMQSHCQESMYTTFMMNSCYKTCTYVDRE